MFDCCFEEPLDFFAFFGLGASAGFPLAGSSPKRFIIVLDRSGEIKLRSSSAATALFPPLPSIPLASISSPITEDSIAEDSTAEASRFFCLRSFFFWFFMRRASLTSLLLFFFPLPFTALEPAGSPLTTFGVLFTTLLGGSIISVTASACATSSCS